MTRTGPTLCYQATPPSSLRRWLPFTAAALALGTAAVYARVVGHDFVNFDDDVYVTANAHVQAGLSWRGIAWALTATDADNWHPLTWLSHMLDVTCYGLRPWGHHLTSVVLHAVNAALLFLAFARLTGAPRRSALVAGLFALHPLHVESVAWVAERKDVLSTSFGIVALLAYSWYAERPGWRRYLGVLGTLAMSLSAKPMLVTLPLVFLLLDFWPLRRGQVPAHTPHPRSGLPAAHPAVAQWLRLLAEKLPLLAIAGVSSALTLSAQTRAIQPLDAFSVGVRLMNAAAAYVRYAALALWPANLAVYYPHPGRNLSLAAALAAAGVLAGVTALAVWQARRRPYLLVGWLWYLGTLVPVIGLVQVGSQALADRYTYVPLIGLFLMLVWGLADLADRCHVPRRACALAALAVLAACAAATYRQAGYWRDSTALWEHACRICPESAVAHNHLADALAARGETAQAVREYAEGIRLSPNSVIAHNNLAWMLATDARASIRDGPRAVALARHACEINREAGMRPALLDTLAAAYAAAGDFSRAAGTAREAIALALAARRTDLAQDISRRLRRYEQGLPARDGAAERG